MEVGARSARGALWNEPWPRLAQAAAAAASPEDEEADEEEQEEGGEEEHREEQGEEEAEEGEKEGGEGEEREGAVLILRNLPTDITGAELVDMLFDNMDDELASFTQNVDEE
eukprot:g2991.t1